MAKADKCNLSWLSLPDNLHIMSKLLFEEEQGQDVLYLSAKIDSSWENLNTKTYLDVIMMKLKSVTNLLTDWPC